MRYASYFYTFDDFPPQPSAAQIRGKIQPGLRRLHAFKHFAERHPDDIRYRLGYIEAYAENGVYDDKQYQHCYDWIAHSLTLQDREGARRKLEAILAELRSQQEQLLAELGPVPEVSRDPFDAAMKRRDYDAIESEFARLREIVKPRGILGGDDEKLLWRLFQMTIRIAFTRDPKTAMQRVDEYEQCRIAVKLTPIPDFDLQETILGFLANQSIESARAKLRFWLANSRMPCINDTIKQHDAFRNLCA